MLPTTQRAIASNFLKDVIKRTVDHLGRLESERSLIEDKIREAESNLKSVREAANYIKEPY